MLGVADQQLEGVRQEIGDSFERFDCTSGASRKIQDQGRAPDSAHSAAQCGKRSFLHAFGANPLGDTFDKSIADLMCSLRRDVAGCNPGAPGGYDEPNFAGQANQQILNLNGVVRDDLARSN